ncbi:MAG: ribonuclease III domain-containing protein [Candidatus Hodarchaeales archaeon]|jgi:ribonuclease-3
MDLFKDVALDEIEGIFDHYFKNRELLVQALTSKGYSNEHNRVPHREKLAALGDAILKVVLVEKAIELGYEEKKFIDDFKQAREPREELGKLLLDELSHPEKRIYFRLSNGEYIRGEYGKEQFAGEFFEAIIGAIYCDSSFEKTRDSARFVMSFGRNMPKITTTEGYSKY